MSFVDIPTNHGHLEALWWAVEQPVATAIVCHPHPLHGGTMHNHLTYRIAQAWREAHVSSVRFNFRGVGRSTGAHDFGIGELDDATAAARFACERQPAVPLLASGFSFGARTALEFAVRNRKVEGVLAVGLAIDVFDLDFVSKIAVPFACIQADRDEFGSLPRVEALLTKVSAPHQLFVLENSTHLAPGRLDAFSQVARQALDWLMPQLNLPGAPARQK